MMTVHTKYETLFAQGGAYTVESGMEVDGL